MIRTLSLFAIFIYAVTFTNAQTLPSPKEHFGFNIGDNYRLATYTQTEAYFKKLAAASDRVKLVDIGRTEEGRSQYMLIVSSPENLKNLNRYKDISQKLARAENLTDEQAHALAREGKAIVWIDGGLHATETVGTHQLIETLWQFVSRKDAESMRILDDAIILFVHANPDGQELVSNWYMRNTDTLKRSLSQLPRLYQKYIGHDNNRDFYMLNMSESRNISKQQYIEWMPQILYNHHQTGPPGSVVAGPPYRDPFNFVFDPLLVTSIDAVGAAMNNRLNVEGKPGYTQRAGSQYSTWWNGGLRTTAYFHNIVGLLTEIIGNPTPTTIPLNTERLIPNGATPNPVTPRTWFYKNSIDYSVSLNYAVLDYAVRNREHLLYNIYRMGRNSIEAGSTNHWTLSPKRIEAIMSAYKKGEKNPDDDPDTIPVKYYNIVFKDSSLRDPRGFIIPSNQPDFPTAIKFINSLLLSGIKIHKATSSFSVEGKNYPAGSYIVKTNQAFRPHVLDMFEPQDHPNDFQYPGGPPVRPYDAAGWTPAFSMGFKFDRILDPFDGPFQEIVYGELQSPKGNFIPSSVPGYILDSRTNNSFVAVNDLLAAGANVYRITNTDNLAAAVAPGSFFIPANSKTTSLLQKAASDLGVNVIPAKNKPAAITKISKMRIALWDTYGGSMPSGWVRWIMEQHHFSFHVIYSKEIDAGNLHDKYDVIVFLGGAIPPVSTSTRSATRDTTFKPETIPEEWRQNIGRISADTSIPQLKKFMEAGGSVVTIGSSSNLAYHLKLPVRNALVEMNNGRERSLPGEKFYIPGSIMRVKIDSTQSASWGMGSEADVYFAASPVFKLAPGAISKGVVTPIAWFGSGKTLRSGWAWGQEYLQDGVAAFRANVGNGKLYAFGPEITFRSQTHGTFKFLFNTLYSDKR
ncbi:MAG TPA: M14 metallopeptidase family protein [Chitinophagaceae bacterium]|nr:M14 metallopeptidase family protein [Chitinophagaceae bacterium]